MKVCPIQSSGHELSKWQLAQHYSSDFADLAKFKFDECKIDRIEVGGAETTVVPLFAILETPEISQLTSAKKKCEHDDIHVDEL